MKPLLSFIKTLCYNSIIKIKAGKGAKMFAGIDQFNGNRVVVYKQSCPDWNDRSAVV